MMPQDTKVRMLEKHLAMEDYPYLDTVESPHVVARYWKKLFLALSEPFIPYSPESPKKSSTTRSSISRLIWIV